MPRIRTIKPEFWSDTKLRNMSDRTRLVFLCLISMADDMGRIEADVSTVCSFGNWLDADERKAVGASLDQLARSGRIVKYETDNNHYLAIPSFTKHQKIDHPTKSRIPEFIKVKNDFAKLRETSRNFAPDMDMDMDMDQGSEYCAEPPSGDSHAAVAADDGKAQDSVVLRFPITGNAREREWPLRQSKLDEYAEAFPGVDLMAEMRRARQWCVDNQKKRKTAKGMPAFLSRWIGTAADRGTLTDVQAKPPRQRPQVKPGEIACPCGWVGKPTELICGELCPKCQHCDLSKKEVSVDV